MNETFFRWMDDIKFYVEVKPASHNVDFRVWQTPAQDLDSDPPKPGFRDRHGAFTDDLSQAELFLQGFVKWDGCSNWSFQDDCMLHFCEREDLVNVGVLLGRLYDIAAEECENWNR